jgi:Asp-tRNA(Asn)/Glu-tRNA(Gln) amidotransferase C subunit
MSAGAEHQPPPVGEDLTPLDELIRRTPGAHPINSVDELRSDAFETDEELEEFLAFVTESRHADLA